MFYTNDCVETPMAPGETPVRVPRVRAVIKRVAPEVSCLFFCFSR